MYCKNLKISFFGSSLVSAYWNGAATYYRGIIRALHDRGHRITFYEPDAYGRQQHRDMLDPEWASVRVYQAETRDGVCHALESSGRADLIIKASGIGVFDEFLESEVLNLKGPERRVVFWDVDAPATLDRISNDPQDPFRALIPNYDSILTYGGGDNVVNAYKSFGARGCTPVYNALDPAAHYPVSPDYRFSAELGFLGNRLPDRESRVDEYFFLAASELRNARFMLGGNGWEDKKMPENVHYLGHVYTADHNAFNCSMKAILNINRTSMATYGFSPPTRVFEAAGAGACVITDAWEGIEHFLDPDAEVLVARSGSDVASHLSQLTTQRAGEIGRAALRRVLAEHTYSQRALQVEKVLGTLY